MSMGQRVECTVLLHGQSGGRVLKSKLRCAIYDYVTDTIPGEVGCGHCGAAEGDQSFIAVIRVTVVGNNLPGMGLFCFR